MEKLNNNINELYKKKYDLIKELKIVEKKIKEVEKERVLKCSHEWITEREPGMYGENFTYCKYCRVNKIW
tara:strand:+ start:636 stop:845 length:210 start_codon:yes stop_codon:yes gene_type:complete